MPVWSIRSLAVTNRRSSIRGIMLQPEEQLAALPLVKNNNSNGEHHEKPPSFRRKKHMKRRYTFQRPEAPSKAHSFVFRRMRHRELKRSLNGIQKKNSKLHSVALFLMLSYVYGVGVSSINDGTLTATIQVKLWQIIFIGFWFLVCSVVLGAFSDSIYFGAILWCFVYWPLLALTTTLIFWGSTTDLDQSTWVFIGLLVAESLTVLFFFLLHYCYPRWIRSEWFEKNITSARYFSVQVLSGWTMTYKTGWACWAKRHTCMYQGEFDEDGLPHGYGHWTDDSAEILMGHWRHGEPMAPFRARQYGTGDALRSVPLIFYMATDDTVDKNKFIPTNDLPPRSGVAGVECNVQGVFYNHYPVVEYICEPKAKSLSDNLRFLMQLDERNPHTRVTIEASSPRGIEVSGHMYQPTGLAYAEDLETIKIRIERKPMDVRVRGASRDDSDYKPECMPFSDRLDDCDDNYPIVLINEDDDDDDDDDKSSSQYGSTDEEDLNQKESVSRNATLPHLIVEDWASNQKKEALIFFAGFNSTVTKTAKTLGQFLAMTRVTDNVIPILFAWPGGQTFTYRYAAEMAASKRNQELLHELLEGLAAEGIRYVHFMSHSMGVQALLNALADDDDGNRSPTSQLFQLDPSFGGTQRERCIDSSLMMCKSVTMLNPDYPLKVFIDRAFLSIRRLCSQITVIGDRNDGALFYSQLTNGLFAYWGHEQPKLLQSARLECRSETQRRKFRYRRVVGKDIKSLYFRLKRDASGNIEEPVDVDKRLLFQGRHPSVVLASCESHRQRQGHWLDLDVIDTAQLEANIKGLRHSGFNLNPILLKDLEELILTGRRASERSALLFREGNIFSYCHVPSHVSL
jgi:hypothetical protein